jgi:hypothetical protein
LDVLANCKHNARALERSEAVLIHRDGIDTDRNRGCGESAALGGNKLTNAARFLVSDLNLRSNYGSFIRIDHIAFDGAANQLSAEETRRRN